MEVREHPCVSVHTDQIGFTIDSHTNSLNSNSAMSEFYYYRFVYTLFFSFGVGVVERHTRTQHGFSMVRGKLCREYRITSNI